MQYSIVLLLRIYFQLYLSMRTKKIYIDMQGRAGTYLLTYKKMPITLVVAIKYNMLRNDVA